MADVNEKKTKISKEAAEAQMQDFLDYYDIDQNDLVVDQGPEAVETVYNRLVRAISDGWLEITDVSGVLKVVQTLKRPPGDVKQLEYAELTAKHKLAIDGFSDKQGNARIHALMGSLCGLGAKALSNLKASDLSIMERLAVLFMVV